MRNPFKKGRYRWICPQCGSMKNTHVDVAPLCKGSGKPQEYNFHLFTYPMELFSEKRDGVWIQHDPPSIKKMAL